MTFKSRDSTKMWVGGGISTCQNAKLTGSSHQIVDASISTRTILLNASAMRNPGFTSTAIRGLVEDIGHCNGATAALETIDEIRKGIRDELNRAEILLDGGVGVYERIETLPKGIRVGVLKPVPLSCPIKLLPQSELPATKDEEIMLAGFNRKTEELEAYVVGKEDALSLTRRASGVRIITQMSNFLRACRQVLILAATVPLVALPIVNFSSGSITKSLIGAGILFWYNAWAKKMEDNTGFSSQIGNPIHAKSMLARLKEAEECILEGLAEIEKFL